ncbi:MAG: DUF2905 domain-containing protein [Chitinophagaceae bacterium]|jgi:hypothetical protein|nr:DUF2905 domain-containing protein [Chitinophagaceae bacterium]
MEKETGKLIMFIGSLVILAGFIWYFAGERLQWIGRLPGDFRMEKGNMRFFFPFTTMLLLSLLINLLIRLYRYIR